MSTVRIQVALVQVVSVRVLLFWQSIQVST